MKKYFFYLIFFCLLGSAQQAFAQFSYPQPNRRSTGYLVDRYVHNIKLNFLSPFVLTANLAYEQFITGKLSFQLGAYYNGITIEDGFLWFDLPYARYRNFAITPEVRFYTGRLTRSKLDGFYIAPFVRYQNTSIEITPDQQESQDPDTSTPPRTYEGSLSSLRFGVVGGYKFIFGERITLEAFAGPSARVAHWLNANINTYNAEDFLLVGLGLRSGMTIGYLF